MQAELTRSRKRSTGECVYLTNRPPSLVDRTQDTFKPLRSTTRSAYTLLEIILVLAILAAMAAIVTPSIGEAFQRQRLNASIDQLRTEWDKARLTAMKTGQIQAFNCTIGDRTYTITPYMTGDDMNNASTGATVMTAAGTVGLAASTGMLTPSETSSSVTDQNSRTLQEEVTFVSCAVSSDMRAMSIAAAQGGLVGMQSMNQTVLFYPDGSTSTAEAIIQIASGTQRAVRIRGLTGSTQVLTPGEIPTVAQASTGANP